jgi:hypothetical protein
VEARRGQSTFEERGKGEENVPTAALDGSDGSFTTSEVGGSDVAVVGEVTGIESGGGEGEEEEGEKREDAHDERFC